MQLVVFIVFLIALFALMGFAIVMLSTNKKNKIGGAIGAVASAGVLVACGAALMMLF